MSKKSATALIIAVVVIILLIWFALFMGRVRTSDDYEDITDETFTNEEQQVVQNDNVNDKYYLIMEGDAVKIYYADGLGFYDYADININLLPDDIKKRLQEGMYINNETRLYEFLESYSS